MAAGFGNSRSLTKVRARYLLERPDGLVVSHLFGSPGRGNRGAVGGAPRPRPVGLSPGVDCGAVWRVVGDGFGPSGMLLLY